MVERVEGLSPVEWRRAYQEIKDFEAQLVGFGTIVIKFWLHISKEEQLRRFQDRQAEPNKAWKLTDEDWRNREMGPVRSGRGGDVDPHDHGTGALDDYSCQRQVFARVQVLKTVAERFARELHVDLSADALVSLPLGAAPTPIPEWAKVEARQYGIKVSRVRCTCKEWR